MLPWLLVLVAGLLGLVVVALLGRQRAITTPLLYGASLLVAAGLLSVAAAGFARGTEASLVLPLGLPWLGAHFRLDGLSFFFLVIVDLGGALASLYGLGYGRHEKAPERVLPFFPAFLAAMNLVVLADDAFTFLFSWEFMSLASWALVIAHHREPDNAKAGFVYIVMASFGTLVLLLAFGLLAGRDGTYDFATIRTATKPTLVAGLVFLLALVGPGSKAGLVPLQVWLPLAHPAAPSHVSALLSGVMTKVAVYGFVRIVFDLLGPPDWWWAVLVLALGGTTSVLGVLYALMEHDIKRLLAYHTVENIGIIFIGLGLALAFQANAMATAAALALTAALFHVLNHSLFKSLLFFGAGSVLVATGERDMEHLGGLIHRMPVTAGAFLVGCAAISALPPLNGFVSEWLTFQAILLSPILPQWGLKFVVPAVGAALALSAALAAACFVKAYGVSFLGRPRSSAAANAHEADPFSLAAMLTLAALCALAGIFPATVIDQIAGVTEGLLHARLPLQAGNDFLSIAPIAASRSSYSGLLLVIFIAGAMALTAFVIHRFGSRLMRRSDPWDCGYPDASPLTQYSASSFAQPIRRVYGTLVFRAREIVEMPPPGDGRPARLTVELHDLVWDSLYVPIADAVSAIAGRLNHFQFLTIRRYLGLVFSVLVALLLGLAIWG